MDHESVQYFNPNLKILHSRNRLPHWQQEGAAYFVTFRLADSMPQGVLEKWRTTRKCWMARHPLPWDKATEMAYHRLFPRTMEKFLDAGYGSCRLAEPTCSRILYDTLLHFNGLRYEMYTFVIMPNHVHLLFQINPAWQLEQLMHSWRRFSAREINKVERRSGSLWQKDYFDRLIRNEVHFTNCVRYIERNPKKANLKPGMYRVYRAGLGTAV
jgi:REP element-mobilizing transposase RayT